MKSIVLAIGVCGLLCCTQSTQAISITINEDSAIRLDFNLVWGEVGGPAPGFVTYYGPLGTVMTAIDQDVYQGHTLQYLWLQGASGRFSPSSIGLQILFPDTSDRTFEHVTLAGFVDAYTDFLELPGNAYGARIVIGASLPPPSGVPEGGKTLPMLMGAMAGLGIASRGARRRER